MLHFVEPKLTIFNGQTFVRTCQQEEKPFKVTFLDLYKLPIFGILPKKPLENLSYSEET